MRSEQEVISFTIEFFEQYPEVLEPWIPDPEDFVDEDSEDQTLPEEMVKNPKYWKCESNVIGEDGYGYDEYCMQPEEDLRPSTDFEFEHSVFVVNLDGAVAFLVLEDEGGNLYMGDCVAD